MQETFLPRAPGWLSAALIAEEDNEIEAATLAMPAATVTLGQYVSSIVFFWSIRPDDGTSLFAIIVINRILLHTVSFCGLLTAVDVYIIGKCSEIRNCLKNAERWIFFDRPSLDYGAD